MKFRAEFIWRKDETSGAMIDFAKDELKIRLMNEVKKIYQNIDEKRIYSLINDKAVFKLYDTEHPSVENEYDLSVYDSLRKDGRNAIRAEFEYQVS